MKTKYQTTLKSTVVSTLLSTCLLAPAANAAQWDVTVSNLTNGNHFTPLFVTANDSTTHLFEEGVAASSAITLMAECGSLAELEVIDHFPPGLIVIHFKIDIEQSVVRQAQRVDRRIKIHVAQHHLLPAPALPI